MQLLRIEASNFRQLKNVEIHFPEKGFIGITGDNGAGKSTLLNLLDWTFYGKYKDVTQKQIRTQKVATNAPTYTVVDFVFNGSFYRVKRDLSSNKSKNFVQKDGVSVANGTTEINDYVREQLFKMDQDSFRVCYYAAQDEFDALVKLNEVPRIRMISRFFKIDSIDDASEKARKDKRSIEIQIEEFKRHMKDEDTVVEQIEAKKEHLRELSEKLASVETELKDLTDKRLLLSREKEKSDKTYEQFQVLSSTISSFEIKRNTLKDHSLVTANKELMFLSEKKGRLSVIHVEKAHYFTLIQKKDALNTEKEHFTQLQRITKQKKNTETNIDYYLGALKEAEEKLKSFSLIEKKAAEYEKLVSEKENVISTMRDEAQELLTFLKVLKDEYDSKKSDITYFESLGTDAPCPTCKQTMGEAHYETELTNLNGNLKKIVTQLKIKKEKYEKIVEKGRLEKEVLESNKAELKRLYALLSAKSGFVAKKENAENELQKQKNELNALATERATLPEAISFIPEAYNQLLSEIKKATPLYEEVIQLEKAIERIPQIEETVEALANQINELDDILKKQHKELAKLNFNKEEHFELAKKLDSIRTDFETKKDAKYLAQSQVDIIRNNKELLEKELKEIQTKKEELSGKQEEVLLLTKLDQLFKTYKTDNLSKIAPTLSDIMSDMIELLTDGRYDRAELDDNYKINVYRQSELLPFEIFSGGEKKLFAICLRLAISQLLALQTEQRKFEMISLDEVFSSFHEKRQDAMVEMFRNLTDLFKQVLVVSHNEHVKNLYDHILHVEYDEKSHTSKVKWLKNDLDQPTFDLEYVEQLVYERYDLDEEANVSN